MPQYTIDEELRPKGLQFVTRIHRMRMLGTLLCMLPIASVLLERSAPLPYWLALAFNALVWPQLALMAGRRSRDPVGCEFRSLAVDSALGGVWIAAMAVSAAPAAVFATLLTADKIAAGGWRLLGRATLALIAGFAVVWTLLGFPFQPVSSPRTLLACLPFMFVYTVALSLLTHRLGGRIRVQNRELHRLTRIDPVMQVPNRPHFEAVAALELSRLHRFGRPASMLLIDVDHFKVINDRYGHGTGDIVLKRIATILRETVRDVDLPSRYGGDEFAVLLVDTDAAGAMVVAERLREEVARQIFATKPGLVCSLSIGVAEAMRDYATLDTWVQAADAALYRAKASGRDRVQCCRAGDQQLQSLQGEMGWLERLHWALDHDGFALFAQEIQPLAAAAHGAAGAFSARKVELLLRMRMPDGEIVTPMAFIPAAERYGLMPRIDRWVIARACRELADLRARGMELPPCMINLSGISVSDPSLADYIAACLRENGLPGALVGFELTETAAVDNLASCSQLMTRLRELGCPIALDDFGTGMSSFSYLRNLPIDFLKIDRAFIRDIGTDAVGFALVETMQRMGSILGVRTVAEGVEDEKVLAALAIIGVDFVQGFHVSQPVPLAQILAVPPIARAGGQPGRRSRRLRQAQRAAQASSMTA